jgi:hypothetical protein
VIRPLVAGALAALAFSHLLVLGSGILPVPFRLILGGAAVGGLLAGAAALLVPRRFRRLRVIAPAVLALVITMMGFKQLTQRALLVAEQYGSAVAVLIERQVAATGSWPADLGSVQGLGGIAPAPAPYLSDPSLPDPKVAGYFLSYTPGPPPRLIVARRELGSEYDWRLKRWRRRTAG